MRYFVNDFRLMWVGRDELPDFTRPPFAQFSGWVYFDEPITEDEIVQKIEGRLWHILGINPPEPAWEHNYHTVAVWRGVRAESILDQMQEADQPALFKMVYDDPAEFGVLQC